MRLFDRRYRLQVDSLVIDGLNVSFSVERTLRRRAGRCEVKVWNLSETHRRQLEALQPGHVFVELHAGYAEGMGRIFRGELHRATTIRSGPDLITTIASRDGRAAGGARTSASFASGASIATVARRLVADMGVDEGNLPDELESATMPGVGSTFADGTTTVGNASEELDHLLASTGREWTIQDGAVQVLRRGTALQRTAVLLSADPDTGLVDSPSRDEHGRLLCKAKMIPDIAPGVLVRVESAQHTGTFRVEHLVAKGELRGEDLWGYELTCAEPTARAA